MKTNLCIIVAITLGLLSLNGCSSPVTQRPTSPTPPLTQHLNVSVNERLSSIPNIAISSIESINSDYKLEIINQSSERFIFDLKRAKRNNHLSQGSEIVELQGKDSSGNVVTRQILNVQGSLFNSDLVVSSSNLTQQDIQYLLTDQFTLEDYQGTGGKSVARLGIGKYTTIQAFEEVTRKAQALIDEGKVSSGTSIGLNRSYQFDAFTRNLDPTCDNLNALKEYATTGSWQIISDKSEESNSLTQILETDGLLDKDIQGQGFTIFIPDSYDGITDKFDCESTPNVIDGHGIHISQIIQHIAPKAKVIPISVFEGEGTASIDVLTNTADLVKALSQVDLYLHNNPEQKAIINLSFSAPRHPKYGADNVLHTMMAELEKRYPNRILMLSSGGNHGIDQDPNLRDDIFDPAGFTRSIQIPTNSGTQSLDPINNLLVVTAAGLHANSIKIADFNPQNTLDSVLGLGIRLCLHKANSNCQADGLTGASYAVPTAVAISALVWQSCPALSGPQLTRKLLADGSNGSRLINGTSANSCDAPLNDKTFELTVNKVGTGRGTVSSQSINFICENGCFQKKQEVRGGQEVILTAQPTTKSTFVSWEGCNQISGTQCTVAMNRQHTVKATFTSEETEFRVFDMYRPSTIYAPNASENRWALDKDLTSGCISSQPCTKVTYKTSDVNDSEVFKVYWLHPKTDIEQWNKSGQPGCNLQGATHISFWARSESAPVTLNMMSAMTDGKPQKQLQQRIPTEWKYFRFELSENSSTPLDRITGGFGFTAFSSKNEGTITFYFDDVRYLGIPASESSQRCS